MNDLQTRRQHLLGSQEEDAVEALTAAVGVAAGMGREALPGFSAGARSVPRGLPEVVRGRALFKFVRGIDLHYPADSAVWNGLYWGD